MKPLIGDLNSVRAGQVYESLRLSDYRVKLLHPITSATGDVWAVEPSGSSAHGAYTARAEHLCDPARYRLVSDA